MKKIVFIALSLLVALSVYATSYQSYATYIFNFIKYMSWPSSYQTGYFVIGVLGSSPLVKDLQELADTKKKGNQEILIKIFAKPQDFGRCHILFIPASQSEHIEECQQYSMSNPTVIITEKVGMAKRGSCINFVRDNGKVLFELNRTTAENIGVQVKSDLVKLASMEIE